LVGETKPWRAGGTLQQLLPIAILDYRNYRDELGRSNNANEVVNDRRRTLPRGDTQRFLLALARRKRVGKIQLRRRHADQTKITYPRQRTHLVPCAELGGDCYLFYLMLC
jgi:hypothetical protein